jgi:hypothetical protein
VQVDVWSKDRLEARDFRELVIAALVPAATPAATRFGRAFVDRLESSWEARRQRRSSTASASISRSGTPAAA